MLQYLPSDVDRYQHHHGRQSFKRRYCGCCIHSGGLQSSSRNPQPCTQSSASILRSTAILIGRSTAAYRRLALDLSRGKVLPQRRPSLHVFSPPVRMNHTRFCMQVVHIVHATISHEVNKLQENPVIYFEVQLGRYAGVHALLLDSRGWKQHIGSRENQIAAVS